MYKYTCGDCGSCFEDYYQLSGHIQEVHQFRLKWEAGIRPLFCHLCLFNYITFISLESYHRHMRQLHKLSQRKSEKAINDVLSIHGIYCCKKCRKRFKSGEDLAEHNEERYECCRQPLGPFPREFLYQCSKCTCYFAICGHWLAVHEAYCDNDYSTNKYGKHGFDVEISSDEDDLKGLNEDELEAARNKRHYWKLRLLGISV